MASRDAEYREELLAPVRKCAHYRPKFGAATRTGSEQEVEMNVDGFRRLYGADPLYAWLGLDAPLMYAAHKAAGGMTSIYRQLGIGCERLVRAVIRDVLQLEPREMQWGYEAVDEKGKKKKLTLDARIDLAELASPGPRERFEGWLARAGQFVVHPRPNELRASFSKCDRATRARIPSARTRI